MKINRILSAVAVGAVGLGLVPVLTATAAQAAPAALAGFDGTHTGVDGNRSVYYRWDASQALSRADLGPTGSATITTVVRADAAAASWTTDGELEAFGFVLDQSKAINKFGIERFSVGEFDTFQQTLQDITDLTGVTFDDALHAVDAMIGSPDESRRRPLRSANEVRSRRAAGV